MSPEAIASFGLGADAAFTGSFGAHSGCTSRYPLIQQCCESRHSLNGKAAIQIGVECDSTLAMSSAQQLLRSSLELLGVCVDQHALPNASIT